MLTSGGPKRWSLGRGTSTVFIAAMVLLVAVAVLAHLRFTAFEESSRRVARADEVLKNISEADAHLADSAAAHRAYLLTGEGAYLKESDSAAQAVHEKVRHLRTLTADNPRQRQRLDALEPLLAARAAAFKEMVGVRADEGLEGAVRRLRAGDGAKGLAEIRNLTGEMEREENDLLDRRSEETIVASRVTRLVIASFSVLSLGLLGAAILLINRSGARLLRAKHELRTAHDELEERVRIRTAELARANEELRVEAEDRRRADEALRASEARFRTLVEQSVVGFYVIQDGRYVYVNPKLTDILGYSAGEMASRPVLDFIAVEDRPLVADNIRKRLEGTVESVRYRLRMCHRDGRVVHLEAHGTRTEYAGRPGILGVAVDVTDHIRSQETLERLAALVACSEDAITGITPAGVITDWNNGAERLFGYTAAEVMGQNIFLLIPPEVRAEADRTLERLQQGEAIPPYEAVRRRKDGSTVVVSVRLSQIKHENRLVGFSLIYHDLTHTKKLEEQLRQAQKMEAVGQLAGGVAHDFNNLLTIINGYSDMLLAGLRPGDPGREPVEQIYKAGERAARLTRQLLAFSRKQVLEPKVLDLNATVGEVARMVQRLIGEDIALTTVLATDLGAVKADPGQVEQVLMNLVVNARDAMPRGGKLTIETANVELDEGYARSHPGVRPGVYAMLAVSDTGTGMDAAIKARIFEPFFTTKGSEKGTGLGLATVFGIVKQSGGDIYVYSEPGRGTTFKIYLPVVEKDGKVSSTPQPGPTPRMHGTETVLLVEDEPAVRALSRLTLQMYGYTVLEAAGGDEAVRVSEGHPGPVHLLLTDVVMPGMSGRELADVLRPGHPAMKVLFLSGYTDDAVVRHGVLAAETAFLQKPFTPVTLATKVREVLGK